MEITALPPGFLELPLCIRRRLRNVQRKYAMIDRMKSKLDPQTTPEQKFARFQDGLRQALAVSKDDLDQRVADAEKIRRQTKGKPGPKPSASGHASDTEV
jgi:hypothetical protein